jgi:hypothetical protein
MNPKLPHMAAGINSTIGAADFLSCFKRSRALYCPIGEYFPVGRDERAKQTAVDGL